MRHCFETARVCNARCGGRQGGTRCVLIRGGSDCSDPETVPRPRDFNKENLFTNERGGWFSDSLRLNLLVFLQFGQRSLIIFIYL